MSRSSINDVIPVDHVVVVAREFLESAGWKLGFDEGVESEIPRDVELRVASRAFVAEDVEGYTWGDHFQAKVLIGSTDEYGQFPEFGTLGIYFDQEGQMITEDRWKD